MPKNTIVLDKRWERMYAELVEFKNQHGHTNVPQRWPENRSLGTWVSYQRGGGDHLPPYRRAHLNALGFRWEKQADRHERVWNETFERLKQYKDEHGDCLVPQHYAEDLKLGHWVSSQRIKYKRKVLSQDRIARLESIGFAWIKHHSYIWSDDRDNSRLERQWMENYQLLVEYHNEYGHSIVPNTFTEGRNEPFGRWIRSQRTAFAEKQLSPKRKGLLDRVQFVYQVDASDAERSVAQRHWDEMFDKLLDFQAQYGRFRVPCKGDSEYKDVYWWVLTQRGQKHTMPYQRAQRLDSIGFWHSSADIHERRWEARLRQLHRYKQRFGTTNVAVTRNKQLTSWTDNQRCLKRKGKLAPSRERQLNSIGFDWEVQRRPARPRKRAEKDNERKSAAEEVEDAHASESSNEEGESIAEYDSEGDDLNIGLKVCKYFKGHGLFTGAVVSKDDAYFKVRYEDGDEEELDEDELRRVVVQGDSNSSAVYRKPREIARTRSDAHGEQVAEPCGPSISVRKDEKLGTKPAAPQKKRKLVNDSAKQEFALGTTVRKYFRGHGWFAGEVIAFDSESLCYKVRFEDGDEEEYTESEMDRIVVDLAADDSDEASEEPISSDDAAADLSDLSDNEQTSLRDSTGMRDQAPERVLDSKHDSSVSPTEPTFAPGTRVRKHFDGHGWFEGKLVSFDHENHFYKVIYEDGDEEEYTEAEMMSIVVDASRPSALPLAILARYPSIS